MLRKPHIAVLDAYGWNDIALTHDFYEVDYLPENDRIRFTIHPDARKEVLKRLLELNHKIHNEEVQIAELNGKWNKKSKNTSKLDISQIEIGSIIAEPKSKNKQLNNLDEVNLFSAPAGIIVEKSKIILNSADKTLKICPIKGAKQGDSSEGFQHISLESPLAQTLLGKKQGEKVDFNGKIFEIVLVW